MSAKTYRPLTFDRVARIVFSLAVAAAVVWLIYYLREALLPFGVGCLIAYMAEPLVQWNMRWTHLRRRLLPVLLTLLEIAVVLGGMVAAFLPGAIKDCHMVSELVHRYADSADDLPFLPPGVHKFMHTNFDLHSIGNLLHDSEVQQALTSAAGFFTGGLDAIGSVIEWAVVILYVLFILLNYPGIMQGIRNMVPPRYRHTAFAIGRDIKTSMNHYFRGQALIALLVGILFSIGFSIIGMPMAIVFGLFIGLLNLVPYLQLISLIPAVFLCIVYSASGESDFWSIFSQCMIVYCVVQSIQDLFLTPKIMGKAMNLNPAIILLSLSVWGTLLGFIGLIIALPLTTLILSYYERYITSGPNARRKWRRKESEEIREVMETPPDGEF